MITHINLLRNVGQFDSVNAGAQLPLQNLSLLYAENGRGKTTLASILRSLATNNPILISERHRLAAAHPPHIILSVANAPAPIRFENNAWTSAHPQILIFDDHFVAQNVCSGIEILSEHKENLHELILGARGVALHTALQGHVERIEEHNRNIRNNADRIPIGIRGQYSVEDFCALPEVPDLAQVIKNLETGLATAKSADAIQQQAEFSDLKLPGFDITAINKLLSIGLPDLDTQALAEVQKHFAELGNGSENWVGTGIKFIPQASQNKDHECCPFCTQNLEGSAIIAHYRAYFSEGYEHVKTAIGEALKANHSLHNGDRLYAFQKEFLATQQIRTFWAPFTPVPVIDLNLDAISATWKVAYEVVGKILSAKMAAPLEQLQLSDEAIQAIDEHHKNCQSILELFASLQATNKDIDAVKAIAKAADLNAIQRELARLQMIDIRYSHAIRPLCDEYNNEKGRKVVTEGLRDAARAALDQYRQNVFPAYEAAINTYLTRFNVGFRLGSVASVNNRGGSSCNYNVLINQSSVPLTAPVGQPSFRTTLSAGDRNTLALAFFFASLDQDPSLAQKIIVIDDPMTSLDEHRSLATVHEIKRLVGRVGQVIILSHSKPFLFTVWEGTDRINRSAIRITRHANGSSNLENWDVNRDSVTEHDRRHSNVLQYINGGQNGINAREIASALRPILESFVRVAYPDHFPPGSLLGPFVQKCAQHAGLATQILHPDDIDELRNLTDYGNRFHHDTNASWQTEIINDHELLGFANRSLAFTRRN